MTLVKISAPFLHHLIFPTCLRSVTNHGTHGPKHSGTLKTPALSRFFRPLNGHGNGRPGNAEKFDQLFARYAKATTIPKAYQPLCRSDPEFEDDSLFVRMPGWQHLIVMQISFVLYLFLNQLKNLVFPDTK